MDTYHQPQHRPGRFWLRLFILVSVLMLLVAGGRYPLDAQARDSGTLATGGITTRVSVASNGAQSNFGGIIPSISANGRYVAFESAANDLVSGDTNDVLDIFVHDRRTSQTTRVSVAADGAQSDKNSFNPSISASGRYVAFETKAGLVNGDTDGLSDVFVHDRLTGATTRVSVASNGAPGDNNSFNPSISADGRYVAFESDSTNLAEGGDTNGYRDVFVHDRQTGETTLVSVASDGAQLNYHSYLSSISASGRYVIFESNVLSAVFVHDRLTGETVLVSVASDGTPANSSSSGGSISADGRYIAFASFADNLAEGGDTNFLTDIFVHDRQTSQTIRVSVSSEGVEGDLDSFMPAISANGRFVTFASNATNLVSGDTNQGSGKNFSDGQDIFVYDLLTGQTTRVSVASTGAQGDKASSFPSISASGRYVAFSSEATTLIRNDTNGASDIFVHTRLGGGVEVDEP